jgi:hypothetical protein
VLDGNTLELELDSPAMNLVGFEHAASTDADKAKVAAARQQLEQPLKLFGLPRPPAARMKRKNWKARCSATPPMPTTMTTRRTRARPPARRHRTPTTSSPAPPRPN